MFNKILVANRGEIACRVMRTARAMGISTVAVYSDADRNAVHVEHADEALHIGPPPVGQSYIDIDRILDAIRRSGAEAVHPGYGFLSENSAFAAALEEAGVAFVGPPVAAIEAMGDKIASKKIAAECGVSTIPGHSESIDSLAQADLIAAEIGYPVMIKASAGGGGKGMRIARTQHELAEGYESSRSEAATSFGDDRVLIEKFIESPRHIEIQVLADKFGNCIHLNERECSIQRRNQKVVEEAPSTFLDQATRTAMGEQAVALARAVNYRSAGTVEFIVDRDRRFYFLEMNTRLQVEHPVTELITGIDLVEQMLRVAWGERLSLAQRDVGIHGWAIESRVYAEDPYRGFLPSTGRLARYRPPGETHDATHAVRNDAGVKEGSEISVYYDPMIAKLCTWANDRPSALDCMRKALDEFEIEGLQSNLPFLSAIMDNPRFARGDITTAFIEEEYGNGFTGVELGRDTIVRLAACAAVMTRFCEIRRARISGKMPHHSRRVGNDWVVSIDDLVLPFRLEAKGESCDARLLDGDCFRISTDWRPGERLARIQAGDQWLTVKVNPISGGFRMRYRGADLELRVRTPRQTELGALMPRKAPPDTTLQLRCPMPGLLVSLAVSEGDRVESGQILCTIEAMKMENILKAERTATVGVIHATPGNILAVDDVIMEFT